VRRGRRGLASRMNRLRRALGLFLVLQRQEPLIGCTVTHAPARESAVRNKVEPTASTHMRAEERTSSPAERRSVLQLATQTSTEQADYPTASIVLSASQVQRLVLAGNGLRRARRFDFRRESRPWRRPRQLPGKAQEWKRLVNARSFPVLTDRRPRSRHPRAHRRSRSALLQGSA